MGFCFGVGGRNAEGDSLAVGTPDPDGAEDGTVPYRAIEADFDVGGIKEDKGDFRQQPGAPKFEFGIQLGSQAGHLA